MKKFLSILLLFLAVSLHAATTNIVILLSTNSLNRTQFNVAGLPLTITNVSGTYLGLIPGTNIFFVTNGNGDISINVEVTNITFSANTNIFLRSGTNAYIGTNAIGDFTVNVLVPLLWASNSVDGSVSNVNFGLGLSVFGPIVHSGVYRNGGFSANSAIFANSSLELESVSQRSGVLTNNINTGGIGWSSNLNLGTVNIVNLNPTNINGVGATQWVQSISGSGASNYWSTNIASAGAISNSFLGDVRINGGMTINATSGGGTFNIGRVNQVGISPYFGFLQIYPDVQGLLVRDADGYMLYTSGFNNNSPGSVEKVGLRTYWNNNKMIDGATVTAWNDSHGGSGAALMDLPVRGPEIWKNQKAPYLVLATRGALGTNNLDNCTLINVSNSIACFRTNLLLQALTNYGVRCAMDVEDGWLWTNRAANGDLVWNTNRFPIQMASQTNLAWFVNTNNMELWLMMYADTLVPTKNNTAILVDISGNNFWEYPGGVNGITGEAHPASTPNTAIYDVSKMYQWGVSGLTLQHNSPGDAFAAQYQEQIRRIFGWNSLFPFGPTIQRRATWRYWYPNTYNGHGIILNQLVTANTSFPESAEFDVNGLAIETGGDATEIGTTVLHKVMGAHRNYIGAMTNWSEGTVHFIPQSDSIGPDQTWTYKDWKDYLSFCATFNDDVWLTSPCWSYMTNAQFGLTTTNYGFLSIWQDPRRGRVFNPSVNATTSVLPKRLSKNEYSVLFVNEHLSSPIALTVTWQQLEIATNMPATVTEVWTNSVIGVSTNSFTVTVPASSSTMMKISPWASSMYATNLASSSGATNLWASNSVTGTITNVNGGLGVAISGGLSATNITNAYFFKGATSWVDHLWLSADTSLYRESSSYIATEPSAGGGSIGLHGYNLKFDNRLLFGATEIRIDENRDAWFRRLTSTNGFSSDGLTFTFRAPTNSPTVGQLLFATSTSGHTAWNTNPASLWTNSPNGITNIAGGVVENAGGYASYLENKQWGTTEPYDDSTGSGGTQLNYYTNKYKYNITVYFEPNPAAPTTQLFIPNGSGGSFWDFSTNADHIHLQPGEHFGLKSSNPSSLHIKPF